MSCKRNLTTTQLVLEIHKAVSAYGRGVQRNTIIDIADLIESQEIARKYKSGMERYWGVTYITTIMSRSNYFDEWEGDIEERYRITWNAKSLWSIEEL